MQSLDVNPSNTNMFFFFLCAHFIWILPLICFFLCMDVVGLASLTNPTINLAPCPCLSPLVPPLHIIVTPLWFLCSLCAATLCFFTTILFSYAAVSRRGLAHCPPDCSQNSLILRRSVPSVCLLFRCQNCCCPSICVWTAASSAAATSTVMPMTPYFMARVPSSLESSFGL